MPNALHREKERGRRTKRSFSGVPSTAANFELLMSLAEEMPPENASSFDPDKPMMQPQENTMRSASAIVSAVRSPFGAATDVVGRSLRERRGIAARKGLRALPSRATPMLALLSNRLGTPKRVAANIESATICAWPASESVWQGQAILPRWQSCVINFALKPDRQRNQNRDLSVDVHPG